MVKIPSFRNSIKSDHLIKCSTYTFDGIISSNNKEFIVLKDKGIAVGHTVEFLEYSEKGEYYTGRTIIAKALEVDDDYRVNLKPECLFKFEVQVILF